MNGWLWFATLDGAVMFGVILGYAVRCIEEVHVYGWHVPKQGDSR